MTSTASSVGIREADEPITPINEAVERLEELAKAAERHASDGWRMFPDIPTSDMTEALERCEYYCDSCKGTGFSGWSGYEALFKNAPGDVISVPDLRTVLEHLRQSKEREAVMREALAEGRQWHDSRRDDLGKQPPSGDRDWRRMEHADEITRIDAALHSPDGEG